MVACPYGVRAFNWKAPTFEASQYLNPDVPVRPVGVVEKCTFCIHRIEKAVGRAKAEGRALRDVEVQTACMQTCTGGAILFGDLDDPNSRVGRLARDRRAFRLLEELATHPRVTYLAEC
jgi:molybdopterin-containing oxidoreductase family iron-sulfur binding subunit